MDASKERYPISFEAELVAKINKMPLENAQLASNIHDEWMTYSQCSPHKTFALNLLIQDVQQ